MALNEQASANRGEVIIYEAPGGNAALDVRLSGDTLWLNLNQLATLFERDKSVISRHLRNVFETGELDRSATVAFFATVQTEGERTVTRDVEHFNLDAILSVGYRVNSRRGTQFRIWASNVLRQHIIRGYSVNERRLRELRLSLQLVEHALAEVPVSADEAAALLRLVTDYSYALDLLDDYDHQRTNPLPTSAAPAMPISYEEADKEIAFWAVGRHQLNSCRVAPRMGQPGRRATACEASRAR